MSNYNGHPSAWKSPQPPFDQEQGGPRRRPKSKKPILPALLLAGGLIVGVGIGSAKPAEVREVTVTKEVPGPERVVEKSVPGPTVEVVPKECLTALDHADAGFGMFSEFLTAIQANDLPGATASTDELGALAPKYNTAKTACRAAQ